MPSNERRPIQREPQRMSGHRIAGGLLSEHQMFQPGNRIALDFRNDAESLRFSLLLSTLEFADPEMK